MLVPMSTFIGATMSVIAFVGFVGNFFTLFVILRYRPLHDVTGMFLANLALADLLQSSFGMPLVASSAFHNQWQFGDSLCTLSGLTNSLFCITSMLTLAAISLDRCFAIVFPLNHFSLLTAKRAGVALVYIWTHAFLIALFPVFGWSRYVYLSYEFICTVQWESSKAYTIFLSLSSFALPLIVTVLSYASVMRVACHQAHETPQLKVGQFERKVTSDGAKENPFVLDVNELMKVEDKRENASLSERRYEKQELELSVMCNVTKKNKAEDDVENSKSVWRDQRLQKQRKRTNVEKEVALDIEQPSEEIILPSLGQRSSSNDALLALRKALECQYADQVLNKVPCPEVSRTNEDSSLDKSVMQGDPASESSRLDTKMLSEDPEMCRLRKACEDVDSSESDLGTTVKEDEKEVLRREGLEPDSTPSNTRLHVGHFARLREWMFLKRTSKEMTDAVLHRKKEMKVVLTLAVVNGTFILCWLPHFIGITCLTFTNGSCPFSDTFFAVTTTLAMLNSGCNPFIYTLTYRKFRKAFQNVLPCFRSSRIRNT